MHYKQVRLHYFVSIGSYFVFDNSHIEDLYDVLLIEPRFQNNQSIFEFLMQTLDRTCLCPALVDAEVSS